MEGFALGIDAGSVSVSLVRIGRDGEPLDYRYATHHGRVRETLHELLSDIGSKGFERVAATSTAASFVQGCPIVDILVASIHTAKRRHPQAASFLLVGGERFARVLFAKSGEYRKMWRNSSCAAGTGSFLDQQARRLGLSGSEELSRLALSNGGTIPVIASRCSVFAKTDIIHAQQEGYSISEICDGLCLGLARNLLDALDAATDLPSPVVVAGGVGRNPAVLRHIASITGKTPVPDELAHVYGAYGAALMAAADESIQPALWTVDRLLAKAPENLQYHYPPLETSASEEAQTHPRAQYLYAAARLGPANPIEVEVFADGASWNGFLGIDIGSTSTKAVLVDRSGAPLAGFYTRTAGQPLAAVQGLFDAIEDCARRNCVEPEISGVATTGSGRRFAGSVVGADLVIDEITAHARAACQLDPEVDTIIEIGGQDAKFTTIRDGVVTFSHMNTVCAAGTGSFIEEQAARLSVPLAAYEQLASGAPSPLASDRCTVFMERDLNHLLQSGYTIPELLAASLHSVRENYLSKVAAGAAIGSHICFQGATGRNRALVAAFEQKLGRPIAVSPFCHLAGALGAALALAASPPSATAFRGLGVHRVEIPVRSERCELCANRCRLRIATVAGEEVAFGFLCGRDYHTDHYVDRNLSGFDLLRERRKLLGTSVAPGEIQVDRSDPVERSPLPSIGVPSSLHLFSEAPFWIRLFKQLGFPVVSGERATDTVRRGREISSAEFCAPMRDLFGQVAWLLERADLVFLPASFRSPSSGKNYCYYTQYAAALTASSPDIRDRIISPLIVPGRDAPSRFAQELSTLLSEAARRPVSRRTILSALETLRVQHGEWRAALRLLYRNRSLSTAERQAGHVSVVLIGRPYTVLSSGMNKRIPEIFGGLGVRVFFQDMIPPAFGRLDGGGEDSAFGSWFPWHHAGEALDAARYCADAPGVYPVYVTSFKCSPDSFAVEYFKQILDSREKPYLILQLDEHDSSVGYETRIEAAVAAFQNHARKTAVRGEPIELPQPDPAAANSPNRGVKGAVLNAFHGISRRAVRSTTLAGKTLLIPTWNTYASPLVAAAIRGHGIDARSLPETPELIGRSMARNSGQCLPVHVIAQETVEYVRKAGLEPARTLLWMMQSDISCNICLYPQFLQTLLRSFGEDLSEIGVHRGAITFQDIAPTLSVDIYLAFLFGGILANLETRIRPYELVAGETDRATQEASSILIACLERRITRSTAAKQVAGLYGSVRFDRSARRPQVAIFGDLYVRDNLVFNQDLPRAIENAGGEAIVTSYVDYVKIVAPSIFQRWKSDGKPLAAAANRVLLTLLESLERLYIRDFIPIVGAPVSSNHGNPEEELRRFGLRLEHEGESADNVLKILHLLRRYPDISLFVEASPAFCCPALVTEAMSKTIEQISGVPVVSITYDGTAQGKNDIIAPYLAFRRRDPTTRAESPHDAFFY